MTTFNQRITDAENQNPVRGDSITVERTVTGVEVDDPIVQAWLTVKAKAKDPDDAAALQLVITTEDSAAGQITDDEGGTTLRFEIHDADYADVVAGKGYVYDIQVKTALGLVSTLEIGTVKWEQDITQTTA